jgi:hypothetical protein
MSQYQNIVAAKLCQAAIGTAYSTIYIVPNDTQGYVKDIDISNTSGSTVTAYVHLVGYGATAGTTGNNSNALLYNVNVPAYSTVQWTGTQILNANDSIQVKASATGLNITVSGAQAT